jgi:transposase-like protein
MSGQRYSPTFKAKAVRQVTRRTKATSREITEAGVFKLARKAPRPSSSDSTPLRDFGKWFQL